MLQRKRAEARLNRALNELLGSGTGRQETTDAIEDMEATLRSLASLVAQI